MVASLVDDESNTIVDMSSHLLNQGRAAVQITLPERHIKLLCISLKLITSYREAPVVDKSATNRFSCSTK